MKTKYQVHTSKGVWLTCKVAQPTSGWLHYELDDGTIGLARPRKWREKPTATERPKAGA